MQELPSPVPARPAAAAGVRAWTAPVLETLPALEELTLNSPISGGEHGFSFLDVTDLTRRLG